jgi:hypothetical protein
MTMCIYRCSYIDLVVQCLSLGLSDGHISFGASPPFHMRTDPVSETVCSFRILHDGQSPESPSKIPSTDMKFPNYYLAKCVSECSVLPPTLCSAEQIIEPRTPELPSTLRYPILLLSSKYSPSFWRLHRYSQRNKFENMFHKEEHF